MRLRHRLLLLVAGVVLTVLAGALLIVYRDVRAETMRRTDADLASALKVYRTLEERSFQLLETVAWSMEGDPTFRYLLRDGDQATLRDHVAEAMEATASDLVVLTDYEGKVMFRSDDRAPTHLGTSPTLQGEVSAEYWRLGNEVFQVALIPVLGAGDVVDGVLALGTRVDRRLAQRLAEDTATGVLFLTKDDGLLATSLEPAQAQEALAHYQALRAPLNDAAGKPVAWLVLVRDTRLALAFLDATRVRLALLAAGALVLALLVAMPWIGRISNPVEELERAQAELQAVFRSTPDGLAALDRHGRIALANPAAARALGLPREDLLGKALDDVLPAEVAADLLRSDRAELAREGHRFQIVRTFARKDVGSLLLLRDVTERREDLLTAAFAREIQGPVRNLKAGRPEALRDLERAAENLLRAAGRAEVPALERLDLAAFLQGVTKMQVHLDETRDVEAIPGQQEREKLQMHLDAPPDVEADPGHLTLILENLVAEAARTAPAGEAVTLTARRDGGAALITVGWGDPGEEATAAGCPATLALNVSKDLAAEQGGRLRGVQDQGGFRLELRLPAALP